VNHSDGHGQPVRIGSAARLQARAAARPMAIDPSDRTFLFRQLGMQEQKSSRGSGPERRRIPAARVAIAARLEAAAAYLAQALGALGRER
jgi:hypothetical protein